MNEKIIVMIIAYFLVSLLSLVLVRASEYPEYEIFDKWTKALYDGEYLQDYLIICKGKKVVNLFPIYEKVYVGKNWIDIRTTYWQNRWC